MPTSTKVSEKSDQRRRRGLVFYRLDQWDTTRMFLMATCSGRGIRLSHVNGRVRCAKVAEDRALIVALKSVTGIGTEDVDVECSGHVVPQLLEPNGRIRQAFLKQGRGAFPAGGYARQVPFRGPRRFDDETARGVPESRFVNPTIDDDAR